MTYTFGPRSKSRLTGVHPGLVAVVQEAMNYQVMDFTILEGVRTEERQERLYHDGYSKTLNSKHLIQEDGYAHAIDIAPYPVDWQDTARFYILNGVMRAAAISCGVTIRSGADWDSDGQVKDQTFHDLPHYEIVLRKET